MDESDKNLIEEQIMYRTLVNGIKYLVEKGIIKV